MRRNMNIYGYNSKNFILKRMTRGLKWAKHQVDLVHISAKNSYNLTLWYFDLRYKTGQLREDLEKVLVTEDLKEQAKGEQIEFSVEIDEQEYRYACMDLVIAQKQAEQSYHNSLLSSRRRSRSVDSLTSLRLQEMSRDLNCPAHPDTNQKRVSILNTKSVSICPTQSSFGSETSDGREPKSDPRTVWHFPFSTRKQLSFELDNATKEQFHLVVSDIFKDLEASKIESLRKCPSPTMALLEELETICPCLPMSHVRDACYRAKAYGAVKIMDSHIRKKSFQGKISSHRNLFEHVGSDESKSVASLSRDSAIEQDLMEHEGS